MNTDTLSEARLAAVLGQRPLQYHLQVSSSNTLAADWLRQGAPSGAVVIAEEQLQGRGRLARPWLTPPHTAIALSVVLHPPAALLSRVVMLAALAVVDAISAYGVSAGIKWANDVQVQGRKLCGILPEATWHEDQLIGVVVGIGLNVRVPFPPELQASAINLEEAAGHAIDRAELIGRILAALDTHRAHIGAPYLVERYRSLLTMLGQRVRVGDLVGIAHDVDDGGGLHIQTEQGMRRAIAGDLLMQE